MTSASSKRPRVHYVVFHASGPAWKYGVDFREQPGVQEHVSHYRQLFERGKLELGGPFLIPDSGGMMVAIKGVTFEEIGVFAAAAFAIQARLLRIEIRHCILSGNAKLN